MDPSPTLLNAKTEIQPHKKIDIYCLIGYTISRQHHNLFDRLRCHMYRASPENQASASHLLDH